MTVGLVFGCFIPLHNGHKKLIETALKENDWVVIAVCGYDTDRGKDYIPFRDRIELMKKIYNTDKVRVVEVDDHKIGLTGTFSKVAWIKWAIELFDNAAMRPGAPNIKYTWYTGEPSYAEKLKSIYPWHNVKVFDRDKDTISGTKIRENLKKYKDQVDPTFLEYLKKKGELI